MVLVRAMAIKMELSKINGIDVAICPMGGVRSVHVLAGVRAGSWYETEEIRGLTHLMEHMCFHGVEGLPNREVLEEYKEEFGIYANAMTSNQMMWFEMRFPDVNVKQGLDLLTKILKGPLFLEERLEREKNIVKQEYQDAWSKPERRFGQAIKNELYGEKHTYSREPLGNMKTVDAATRTQLVEIFAKSVTTGNLLISVAGNVDEKEIKAQLGELNISKGEKLEVDFEPIAGGKNRIDHIEPRTESAKIQWIWKCEGRNRYSLEDRVQLALVNYMFGGSQRSVLYKRLRGELGLVYWAGSGISTLPTTGDFSISTSVDIDKFEQIDQEVKNILKKYCETAIDEKEFVRGRDYLNWQALMAYDSVYGIADGMFGSVFHEGKIFTPDDYINIRSLTTAKKLKELFVEMVEGKEPLVAVMRKE